MLAGRTEKTLKAIKNSPQGITTLDLLESLGIADRNTLKTTLSILNKTARIIRLKRGVYSTNPIQDPYICAQNTYNGYLGFTTALYLHKLITELPFTATVVTTHTSKTKTLGQYEFRAVALKEKAIGFERKGDYILSTRAKTLFDCLYLPGYSVEEQKLINAFKDAELTEKEWQEFRSYMEKLVTGRTRQRMIKTARRIRRDLI